VAQILAELSVRELVQLDVAIRSRSEWRIYPWKNIDPGELRLFAGFPALPSSGV